MNIRKLAFVSASCLILGVTALAGPSFAAEPVKKPAVSQPGTPGKAAPGDTQKECPMSDRMAAMKCDRMGGMGCEHMGGMKCDQMGGMMCEHKGGMMGGQMGGMMCDHKGGMMGGHMGGMMCDHKGGMMGGHMGGMMEGHGAGMMGSPHAHMVMSLDLSDEQRSRIIKLSDELKHDNWATKGLIMDESAKLRDLYAADKRDPSAIGKEYQKIFDLKRQMIEATITTQNRVEELLTPEQRAKLKNMRQEVAPMDKCPMH